MAVSDDGGNDPNNVLSMAVSLQRGVDFCQYFWIKSGLGRLGAVLSLLLRIGFDLVAIALVLASTGEEIRGLVGRDEAVFVGAHPLEKRPQSDGQFILASPPSLFSSNTRSGRSNCARACESVQGDFFSAAGCFDSGLWGLTGELPGFALAGQDWKNFPITSSRSKPRQVLPTRASLAATALRPRLCQGIPTDHGAAAVVRILVRKHFLGRFLL
jgi:hypothetical protein